MSPLRLKLTITVMSMPGWARDAGGGFQQVLNFANTSWMVLTCTGSACAVKLHKANSARADQMPGLPCQATAAHLMSDATCTFTILSGSVTVPPEDPGGAFFNLSITSIPDTTSPITVYCPFRLGASVNMKKNCEFAVSTLSPRRAMPTMPRLNGTPEDSALRLGYFEPPVPLKFWPSPVCAIKPSITRWNGTLL